MDVTIECICPPKGDEPRHPKGDTITLRDRLDFRAAIATRNAVLLLDADDDSSRVAEILATLTEQYLLWGIVGWSLVNDKGKAIDVSKGAIRAHLLTREGVASRVGDAADELYAEQVMLPLLVPALTSSPPTPTDGSTSATTGSEPTPLTRSKRSSTTTTPTADTATTTSSLDGGSNSSPSSTSAA